MKFETLVIYTQDEVIDLIHGKNSELLRLLKKHECWETMMEELEENSMDVDDINDLNLLCGLELSVPLTIKIKLFKNQDYKH